MTPCPPRSPSREIAAALNALEPGTLLFLTNIERLRVRGTGVADAVIERTAAAGQRRPGRVAVCCCRRDRRGRDEWLVWHASSTVSASRRSRVEIAFRVEAGRIAALGCRSPLTVFFPTEKETFLGFLIQGPYRTTPARDNVPEHDPSNQALVRETAALLVDVLRELRDDGLLTVRGAARRCRSRPRDSRPARCSARCSTRCARRWPPRQLIPLARGGGYGAAGELKLAARRRAARAAGRRSARRAVRRGPPGPFRRESITENRTPVLWRYLRERSASRRSRRKAWSPRPTARLSRRRSPMSGSRACTPSCSLHAALWRASRIPGRAARPGPDPAGHPARRRQPGRAVRRRQDRPAVYLPGPAASSLPTVRRAVAGLPRGPAVPGRAESRRAGRDGRGAAGHPAQVPRPGVAALDPAQHDADLECVVAGAGRGRGRAAGRSCSSSWARRPSSSGRTPPPGSSA